MRHIGGGERRERLRKEGRKGGMRGEGERLKKGEGDAIRSKGREERVKDG